MASGSPGPRTARLLRGDHTIMGSIFKTGGSGVATADGSGALAEGVTT
jgi:hypothetical protein